MYYPYNDSPIYTGPRLLEPFRIATWVAGLPLLFAGLSYTDNMPYDLETPIDILAGLGIGFGASGVILCTPVVGKVMDLTGLTIGRFIEIGIGTVRHPKKTLEKMADLSGLSRKRKQ